MNLIHLLYPLEQMQVQLSYLFCAASKFVLRKSTFRSTGGSSLSHYGFPPSKWKVSKWKVMLSRAHHVTLSRQTSRHPTRGREVVNGQEEYLARGKSVLRNTDPDGPSPGLNHLQLPMILLYNLFFCCIVNYSNINTMSTFCIFGASRLISRVAWLSNTADSGYSLMPFFEVDPDLLPS